MKTRADKQIQSLPVQLKLVLDVPIGDIDMVTAKPCNLIKCWVVHPWQWGWPGNLTCLDTYDLLFCNYKIDKGIERVPLTSQFSREGKTEAQFTSV